MVERQGDSGKKAAMRGASLRYTSTPAVSAALAGEAR
jgi:hypothetical protein